MFKMPPISVSVSLFFKNSPGSMPPDFLCFACFIQLRIVPTSYAYVLNLSSGHSQLVSLPNFWLIPPPYPERIFIKFERH